MSRDTLVWWIDRCLGARTVPDALRAHGVLVRTYEDLYPDIDDVADVTWIPEVTRRGWVILTKDQEIRRNPAELAVLRAAGARYVCLSAKNMRGDQQAECNRSGVQWLDGKSWRDVKAKRSR